MKFEHEKNKAKESQLLLTHLQQQVQRQEDEIAAYREYHEALSPEYLQFKSSHTNLESLTGSDLSNLRLQNSRISKDFEVSACMLPN